MTKHVSSAYQRLNLRKYRNNNKTNLPENIDFGPFQANKNYFKGK